MADGAKFRKGWSGSPFHLGYDANEGMGAPGTAEMETGPRIGSGVLGDRVTTEVQRDGGKLAKGRMRGRRAEAE